VPTLSSDAAEPSHQRPASAGEGEAKRAEGAEAGSSPAGGGGGPKGVSASGLAYSLSAYMAWAAAPIYFKAVAAVPEIEVLAHRVIWGVLLLGAILTLRNRWNQVTGALRNAKVMRTLLLTTALISVNWFTYIWATANEQILEASLGYYINPLVNIALGMIVLKERLNRAQWMAIGLAAAGVTYMTIGLGALPIVSLVLAFSFGFYALLRKRVAIEAIPGLTIETAMLAPLGLAYALFVGAAGTGSFLVGDAAMNWLLPAAGVVTVVPLLWFTAGARKLPMITIGMLQYTAPTGQLLLAVLAYGEAFRSEHAVAFGCIWMGLGIYSFDLARRARKRRRERTVIEKAKPA